MLFEDLFNKEKRNMSVQAHYGMNDKEFVKLCKAIFISLADKSLITDTIDKYFPNLSAADRLTVWAFCMAEMRMDSLMEFEKKSKPDLPFFLK